ncbi:MAG: glycosyltransferase [Erysipelotrichaceae bacterium]
MNSFLYNLNWFFMIYLFVYFVITFISIIIASLDIEEFYEKKKYVGRIALNNKHNYIPISILVPAYNEEITIIDSVNSLLKLDYPEYEIIIINDGSIDDTSTKVISSFNLERVIRPIRKQVISKNEESIYERIIDGVRITLVNKKNGGKADALNMGINLSSFPLFISLDSDSLLQRDSLLRIVEPFLERNDTIAVGGSIRLINGVEMNSGRVVKYNIVKKPVVLFQMVEYLRVFLISRIAFHRININMIMSGAFGLFRKQEVIDAGGYTNDIIGEDMELVVKLTHNAIKNNTSSFIAYVPDAICWTQVPQSFKDLHKQRRRWHMGLLQSLSYHSDLIIPQRGNLKKTLSFWYYMIYELASPIIEIIGIIILFISYNLGAVSINFILPYLLLFVMYNLISSIVAIMLEKYLFNDKQRSTSYILLLIFISFIESFGYRQLISLWRIEALIRYGELKDIWGHIERQSLKN